MITGAHFLFYSATPDEDRAFLRDVLGFRSVELEEGWLIFGLPASELAVHPAEKTFVMSDEDPPLAGAALYLMCSDVRAFVAELAAKGVACGPLQEAPWGTATTFRLPGGGHVGVYQPTHRTAI